jgi:hypothetical protein
VIRPAAGARFAPGDTVRVRDVEQEGHVRTPDYTKGKHGTISEILGAFPNPELLAYGGDGLPEMPLYKVAFRQADLWKGGYGGSPADVLFVDIYEHWLEPREHGGEERRA